MTIVDMLGQSALLTGLGMGVVFGFLIILIIFMTITSKVIKALGLDKDVPKSTAGTASAAPAHCCPHSGQLRLRQGLLPCSEKRHSRAASVQLQVCLWKILS